MTAGRNAHPSVPEDWDAGREEQTAAGNGEVAHLVRRAASGDAAAWDTLVDRYSGLVWGIARSSGLTQADAADVSQTTWLRLFEHIGRLHDPGSVGSWLATTTRRQCRRTADLRRRLVLISDAVELERRGEDAPSPEKDLVTAETVCTVRSAVARLPENWRQIVELLLIDPPLSYQEIADVLDVPVGSIGPTRGRCLGRLRTMLED